MLRILLSLALAAFVAVGTAYAQEAPKKDPGRSHKSAAERFKEKDTNGDGKLSLEEFKGKVKDPKRLEQLEKAFKAIDKDGDGFVTPEEMKAARAERGHHKKSDGKTPDNKTPDKKTPDSSKSDKP